MGSVAGDGLVYDGLGLGRLGFTTHGLSSTNRLAWPCYYSKIEMHERETRSAQGLWRPRLRPAPRHGHIDCIL